MDPDPPKRTPRKVRYRPNPPPAPRPPRFTTPEIEEDGDDDKESQEALSRILAERLARRGERVEKKSSARVTLLPGAASTSIRSSGKQSERTDDGSKRTNDGHIMAYPVVSATSEMQDLVTSKSATQIHGVSDVSVDSTDAAVVKDYDNSGDPITLPFTKTKSDVPEVLEVEETLEYKENSISSASELGLQPQDRVETSRMLVFNFPPLPLDRQPTNANRGRTEGNSNEIKGKEIAGSSMDRTRGYPLNRDDCLDVLPEGYMGKMLVYKSGAVKLKLGDVMFDVSPGIDSSFCQKVMAINVKDKLCCEVGEVKNNRALVIPNIDKLLESERD